MSVKPRARVSRFHNVHITRPACIRVALAGPLCKPHIISAYPPELVSTANSDTCCIWSTTSRPKTRCGNAEKFDPLAAVCAARDIDVTISVARQGEVHRWRRSHAKWTAAVISLVFEVIYLGKQAVRPGTPVPQLQTRRRWVPSTYSHPLAESPGWLETQ